MYSSPSVRVDYLNRLFNTFQRRQVAFAIYFPFKKKKKKDFFNILILALNVLKHRSMHAIISIYIEFFSKDLYHLVVTYVFGVRLKSLIQFLG